MVAVGINSMKEVVIGITEKLGNGWQVISTVIKSLGTTQKRVERARSAAEHIPDHAGAQYRIVATTVA